MFSSNPNDGKREKRKWEHIGKQKQTSKMANLYQTIVIITLNLNGINTPFNRQKLSDWKKK